MLTTKIVIIYCCLFSFINRPSVALVKSNQVLNHLGTRTPYRFKSNKNDSIIKFPGCKAKKIWMVVRHGTRLPSPKDIQGMNTTLNHLKYDILLQHIQGNGALTKEQLSYFKNWSSNIIVEDEKILALEGQDEMILLAERMQNRFPAIIKHKYDNETFLFKYTATERTQQSARFFVNGLFEQKHAKDVIFAPATVKDVILRFYKHCDKWQKQVKTNPDTYKELKKFIISHEMNKTLDKVSKRLGFDKVLSFDDVKLMFKVCGYETAWNKYFRSPWCAAFDEYSAEVMEYFFDIKHYWVDGYGLELAYRQACMSLKNMFEHFSHKNNPKAVFLFSHSGTLLKIISHLGLYKPASHLRADNLDRDRKWKATNIDCFATNLAFVLFGCKDGDRVLTMHQERIIQLPACTEELCPLKHLIKYYHDSIYNCNYSDMCSLDKNEL